MIVRPEAEADIADAQTWYNNQRPGLGNRFVVAIRKAVRRIQRSPLIATQVQPGVRRALVDRPFPYAVFYLVTDGPIVVIAVMHGRRDPSAWQSRV